MVLHIHGQNLTVTDGLKEFAEKKLGKLDRYLPGITELNLELSRTHTKRGEDMTIAQITLRHTRGAVLRAEEKLRGSDRDTTMKAILAASEKMYRQIERFKGKNRDKNRRKDRAVTDFYPTEEELEVAETVPDWETIVADYPVEEAEVVRRKAVELKPMTEDEAIEQMELLGHRFFMFMNAETSRVNVVYLREDGGYGVLQPEQ
ncbi:MAG: ribosome hibernation-promoting factor, HPF/YfiA family [Chloroflexota bacterium]